MMTVGFVMDHYIASEAEGRARVCIAKSIATATAIRVNVATQTIDSNTAAESKVDHRVYRKRTEPGAWFCGLHSSHDSSEIPID